MSVTIPVDCQRYLVATHTHRRGIRHFLGTRYDIIQEPWCRNPAECSRRAEKRPRRASDASGKKPVATLNAKDEKRQIPPPVFGQTVTRENQLIRFPSRVNRV